MNVSTFAVGAVAGMAVLAIASNPRRARDCCSAIFNNTIVKGACIGLAAGTALSGYLLLTVKSTPSTTMANVGAGIIMIAAPPILGALGGAISGGILSICGPLCRRISFN